MNYCIPARNEFARTVWSNAPASNGGDAGKGDASPGKMRRTDRSPWRVLIVEDEALVALDLSTAFMRSGFEVVGIAATCDDAVQKALATRADVVVADIHLGDGDDGIIATQQIRAQRQTAILYITAYREPSVLERLELGPDVDVFFKPFNVASLIDAVRRLLPD